MIAIEFVKDRKTKESFLPLDPLPHAITQYCANAGLIVRGTVGKYIISPRLTFTKAHADQATAILDEAFSAQHL